MTYPRKVMDMARKIGATFKDKSGAKLSAMTVLTGRIPAANAARMKLARALYAKGKGMTIAEIAKAIGKADIIVRGYVDPAFKKLRDFHNSRKTRAKNAAKRKGKKNVKRKAAKKAKAKKTDVYVKIAKKVVAKKSAKKTKRKFGKSPALAAPYGKKKAKAKTAKKTEAKTVVVRKTSGMGKTTDLASLVPQAPKPKRVRKPKPPKDDPLSTPTNETFSAPVSDPLV